MKSLKKFLLTTAMTMIVGTSAFAASGFEFLLNVPFGVNWGIPNKEAKDLSMKGGIGGGFGVEAQLGYMFQVVDRFGISLLAELGYSLDIYTFEHNSSGNASGYYMQSGYHSFKVGLLPKFNIGLGGRHGLAVGIGGGVKIPVAGNLTLTYHDISNPSSDIGNINGELNRQDISDRFSPSVIGYMKVTFDYYLFFTDNIAMNFGLYLGGDFGMKAKEGSILNAGKIGGDAFNFGLQLGFRFGPKA